MIPALRPFTLLALVATFGCSPARAPDQLAGDAGSNSCGLLGLACCTNQSCGGGLACADNVCQQPRQGDLGKPCTRNADCMSNTCLPIEGKNVCTIVCANTGDCTSGWSCDPLSRSTNVCFCQPSTEVCDGTDNDCDGIVDNQPAVNLQCGRDQGSRFQCAEGRCTTDTCTSTADCLAGETCNPTTRLCESLTDGGHVVIDAGPDSDGGFEDDAGLGPVDGGPGDGGHLDGGAIDGGFGVDGGCVLSGNATLDFGTVGIGVDSRRDYVITNTGTGACTFPQAPSIASGAASTFAVISFPTSLAVGQNAAVTVSYVPQDTTADTGQLRIAYGNSSHGTDLLNVLLQGTPTASSTCHLQVTPAVSSTPGTLDFGAVRLQTEKILPVTLQNIGSANCTLQNARLVVDFGTADPAFRIVQQPTATLAPGATTTAQVGFAPTAEIDYGTATPFGGTYFRVNTSDMTTFSGGACSSAFSTGPAGCVGYQVSGSGADTLLRAVPASVDFGTVKTSCNSADRTVRLYNTRTTPLTVTGLSFDPNLTSFVVVEPSVPFSIAAGASGTVRLRYRPASATRSSTDLRVSYQENGIEQPAFTVPVTGLGTSNAHQTDSYSQSLQPQADVLLVVDDSGSMAEEQGLLASNAAAFLNIADVNQTDYHIGVVTTDMDDATKGGRFQGTPRIVVPGANAATQLSNTIRALGTNGSGTEQGLAAMYAALNPPLIDDALANGGFLRPDARLAVVVVSDEDDQSPRSTAFYSDFLTSLKGPYGAPFVALSAIVGPPAGCTSANGDAVAGTRYIEVQQQTGGSLNSICDSNWGAIASALSQTLFSARNTFTLSRVPSGAVTVRVNNSTIGSSNYAFDSASNAIVFSSGAVPSPGASVSLDYTAQCF